MKKVVCLVLFAAIAFASCKKDDNPGANLREVSVQLKYPNNSEFTAKEGVTVKITSNTLSAEAKTNANGQVNFSVPVGVYEISSTDSRSDGIRAYLYNGIKSGLTVGNDWVSTNVVTVDLAESQTSQVIIKEVFIGGTIKDDASGVFTHDKYIILYNNSSAVANLGNLCFATTAPYNSTGSNAYYGGDGQLTYATQGWIPAGQGFWYFQQNVTLDPGKQIVVAVASPVNNTITYSKSINFDNADYYCMYDLDDYNFAAAYPAPAASIPVNHYLKAEKYGKGTSWTLSNRSPGLFIFNLEGTTPANYAADISKTDELGTAFTSKKVPVEWIVDALEGYELGNAGNKKRFTAAIDAGYVHHNNELGYAIYRNVDKAATEAFPGNAGKIVYNYNLGTVAVGGTTDPSGIDAEASAKNGARILYMDTNNSTNDFHLRSKPSLRTN